MKMSHSESEALNESLNNAETLRAYKESCDTYTPGISARLLGGFLVTMGNVVYGREPSYLKFRAVEVIARVPYHSWASAVFTLLTLTYTNEKRAMRLSRFSWFSEFAQDNETMHVVVISQLAKREGEHSFIRGTLIPTLFAFFYFWASYWLYLFSPRSSLELNYLFESHAFSQYSRFLEQEETALKKKHVHSDYLESYGRHPRSQYDFFLSVRNDELIHRNASIREIHSLESNS